MGLGKKVDEHGLGKERNKNKKLVEGDARYIYFIRSTRSIHFTVTPPPSNPELLGF